ncbi:hypothetical protein LLG46_10505 [bacterium]|nr:hypothetical protein [bacterium]
MENPKIREKNIRDWIEALYTVPSTFFQVVFHPSEFLKWLTRNANVSSDQDIIGPVWFWCLNTFISLIVVDNIFPKGNIHNSLKLSLPKLVMGSMVFWFFITIMFRGWNREQRWLVAKIICYASAYYLPYSILSTWICNSIGQSLYTSLYRCIVSNTNFQLRPQDNWQTIVAACGLAVICFIWFLFIVKGIAMVGKKPKRSRRLYFKVMISIAMITLVNGCFYLVDLCIYALPAAKIYVSCGDLSKPLKLKNLAGYENLEKLSRTVAADHTFKTTDRYLSQQLVVIGCVASEELLAESKSIRGFANKLWQQQKQPEKFEETYALWIPKIKVISDLYATTDKISRWENDLKTLRSLRYKADFQLPKEGTKWGICFYRTYSPPLLLWPSRQSRSAIYVGITKQNGQNAFSTLHSIDHNPFR